MTLRLASLAGLIAALALSTVLIAACGGSSDGGRSQSSGGSNSADSSGAGTGNDDTSEPEDGDVDEPSDSDLFALLQEESVERPADLPMDESPLGGTPLYAAADAIKQTLLDGGVPLDGLDIYVLPVSATGTSLLVIEASLTASTSDEDAPDEITPALSALVASEAVQAANVTRVVLNLLGEDAEGAFVLTITMPLETLSALAEGGLSEEEMEAQLLFGIERP